MRKPPPCRASALGIGLCLLGLLCALPAEGRSRGRASLVNIENIEIYLAGTALTQWLQDVVFTGSGHYPGGSMDLQSFRATGRSLGIVRPWLGSFELGFRGFPKRFFVLGVVFGVGGGHADARPRPTLPPLPSISGDLTSFRLGVEIAAVLPLRWFRLSLGAIVGYRTAGTSITGFDTHPCKGGSCYPWTSIDQVSVEPRLWVMVPLGRTILSIGGFAGGEVVPPFGVTCGAGVVIGGPPQGRLLW